RTILRERRRAARKAGDAEAVRVAESIGEPEVIVEVALEPDPDGGYRFLPRARVSIPGIDPETTRELALAAHARCPVSKLLTAAGDHPVEV
ncbi:hypothetical protein MJ643_30770, partial [Pseudomonas sp. PNPG3]|nr:hypothetical protein [Pseudomonas sp. PNPG3]